MSDNPWFEQLYDVFDFLVENPDFDAIPSYSNKLSANPKNIASAALKKWDLIKNKSLIDNINIPLIEIPILDENIAQKHRGSFLIGGNMEFDENILIDYSFSLCIIFATVITPKSPAQYVRSDSSLNMDSCCLTTCKDTKRIIRRIHFDYQKNRVRNKFHMQVGGKFPNDRHFGNLHYCLEHFLEKPRIPCRKTDYVSLFDYLIHEFNSPLDKWRINTDWIDLVRNSEILLKTLDDNQ